MVYTFTNTRVESTIRKCVLGRDSSILVDYLDGELELWKINQDGCDSTCNGCYRDEDPKICLFCGAGFLSNNNYCCS